MNLFITSRTNVEGNAVDNIQAGDLVVIQAGESRKFTGISTGQRVTKGSGDKAVTGIKIESASGGLNARLATNENVLEIHRTVEVES